MSYLWNEFNIKTFPAETIVYRDGQFCADLSTLPTPDIPSDTILPVHVIYVGEIAGEHKLDLNISGAAQRVFLSVKIKNKLPAFLNIFIKNTGKDSELRGGVVIQNYSEFNLSITAHHTAPDTGILIHTKLVGHTDSQSTLSGVALIDGDAPRAVSDISFAAMCAPTARVTFTPNQRIASIPTRADHGAAIYQAPAPTIQFLRAGGLGTLEIKEVLEEAFQNDIDLF